MKLLHDHISAEYEEEIFQQLVVDRKDLIRKINNLTEFIERALDKSKFDTAQYHISARQKAQDELDAVEHAMLSRRVSRTQ